MRRVRLRVILIAMRVTQLMVGAGLLLALPARAEPQFEGRFGLGVTYDRTTFRNPDFPFLNWTEVKPGIGLTAAGGVRVLNALAVAARIALSQHGHAERQTYNCNGAGDPYCQEEDVTVDVTSLQLGVEVNYSPVDRLWFGPWVGVDHRTKSRFSYDIPDDYSVLAYGLTAGGDLVRRSRKRVCAYLEVAHSTYKQYGDVYRDLYIGAGIGVRLH